MTASSGDISSPAGAAGRVSLDELVGAAGLLVIGCEVMGGDGGDIGEDLISLLATLEDIASINAISKGRAGCQLLRVSVAA